MINPKYIKQKIRNVCKEFSDGVLIMNWGVKNPNFIYILGYDLDYSFAYIDKSGLTIFTTELNKSLCYEKYGKIGEVVTIKKISEIKKRISLRCAVDYAYAPYSIYKRLKDHKNASKILLEIREVKDNREINIMRTAYKKSIAIINGISKMTNENDMRKQILVSIARAGYTPAFEPIVANSSNARYPHYKSGYSRITDYVLVDMGIDYLNYKSDITRCIGKVPSEYDILRNITFEISDIAYAGMEINEFIAQVDNILLRNKIPAMPHSIGHGIGLEVHELPYLRKSHNKEDVLKENSVITIEPGIYNNKGLRYEDMFIIGKKRANVM